MTQDPLLRDPILIVGTGRCGSTLLHRILAHHEDLGWFSPYNELFPERAWLSGFSNLYRRHWLGERVRHLPFFPKPFETYRFWEHYLPGFSRRDRPLTAADVPPEGIAPVRAATAAVLRRQGRRRLLVKVTGWARMAYFERIFPGTRFVWLDRNPLSVVSSWVQADWLDVSSSPTGEGWQWGPVPAKYLALWQELGGGPLLSAALKIQMDLDDIARNAAHFPERTYRFTFEELITEPDQTLRNLCTFLDLPWTRGFAAAVAEQHFYNPSGRWRNYITDAEAERVRAFFARAQALHPAQGAVA